MHESISKYISFCLRKIILHLKKFKVSNKMEDIHEIRVYIKKLRAALKMTAELENKKFESKILDRLFDDAGQLRELQVDIRILNKYKKRHTKLFNRLKTKLKNRESEFLNQIPGYINKLNKLEDKDRFKHINWPQQPVLKKYFNGVFEKISEKKKQGKRKQLHHFRMDLKRMMYIYNALPATKRSSLGINAKSIDQMQDKLGKWHDLFVVVELLKKYKLHRKKAFSDIIENERKTFDKCRVLVLSLVSLVLSEVEV